jgi:hypothetical protein
VAAVARELAPVRNVDANALLLHSIVCIFDEAVAEGKITTHANHLLIILPPSHFGSFI